MIFKEVNASLRIDVDVSGSKANRKYITFFALFTLIPSILISLFSLFILSFALDKYLDKKVTLQLIILIKLQKVIQKK